MSWQMLMLIKKLYANSIYSYYNILGLYHNIFIYYNILT